MGQQSKIFALPEERVAAEEISEGRRKECATPSIGRKAQNAATSPHFELGLMKDFVEATDWTESAFKYLAVKFPLLSETKIKDGVLWVFRFANSSKTTCLTA